MGMEVIEKDGMGRGVDREKKTIGKGRRWRGWMQTHFVSTGMAQSNRLPQDVSTTGGRMDNGRTSEGWKA